MTDAIGALDVDSYSSVRPDLRMVPDPSPLDSVSMEVKRRHFVDVARRALPLWGYPADAVLDLLNITENATYKVSAHGLDTIIMRVHRLEYASKDSIECELAWIRALRASTDLHLATPLRSRSGQWVETISTAAMGEQRNVVCFSFEEGHSPRDSQDDTEQVGAIASAARRIPDALSLGGFRAAASLYDRLGRLPWHRQSLSTSDVTMYEALGRIAATLHLQAQSWRPPHPGARIEWNWDATFSSGWNNFYGRHYWDDGLLPRRDTALVDSCARLMKTRLEAYGQGSDRYGMVHSDLRMANLLKDGEGITVLDFDDCGPGWFMYDLAGIVGFMEHRPDLSEILRHVVHGYRSRRPLGDEDVREIPTFVMMRRIGLLQAMAYHVGDIDEGEGESVELTPEILQFYARGTALLARRYVTRFSRIPLAVQ